MGNCAGCAGSAAGSNGLATANPVLSRPVARAIRFRGVITATEALRWQERYALAGFDLVDVIPDGAYYTCKAVKYR